VWFRKVVREGGSCVCVPVGDSENPAALLYWGREYARSQLLMSAP